MKPVPVQVKVKKTAAKKLTATKKSDNDGTDDDTIIISIEHCKS